MFEYVDSCFILFCLIFVRVLTVMMRCLLLALWPARYFRHHTASAARSSLPSHHLCRHSRQPVPNGILAEAALLFCLPARSLHCTDIASRRWRPSPGSGTQQAPRPLWHSLPLLPLLRTHVYRLSAVTLRPTTTEVVSTRRRRILSRQRHSTLSRLPLPTVVPPRRARRPRRTLRW